MDFGGSCVSLSSKQEIYTSHTSLNRYEEKATLKSFWPQILASITACLMSISVGCGFGYGAVLVPQLNHPNSTITITPDESTWIVSLVNLSAPVGTILVGFLIDWVGRLNTLKISVIPACAGWICIIVAKDLRTIMIGRVLTGIFYALGANPGPVYITEIASPKIRSSLVSITQVFTGTGLLMAYVLGWLFHWRTIAWIQLTLPIVFGVFLFFIPESPPWLVDKGKEKKAKKALEWLYKYYPQPNNKKQSLAELHLQALVELDARKKMEQKRGENVFKKFIKEFKKPTGYKPFFYQMISYTLLNYSGLFHLMMYTVTFIQATGTTVNPFVASIFVGIIRLVMSTSAVFLLKRFPRRVLMLTSLLSMAICFAFSGYFTGLIQEGKTTVTWIPVVFLFLVIMTSSYGALPIPWTISAEIYPLAIRGVMHSINMINFQFFGFVSTKAYVSQLEFFGGSVGIQYFFAVMSTATALFVFVFMPETKDKSLIEIEEYFCSNTVYLGEKIAQWNRKNYLKKLHPSNGKVLSEVDEEELILEET